MSAFKLSQVPFQIVAGIMVILGFSLSADLAYASSDNFITVMSDEFPGFRRIVIQCVPDLDTPPTSTLEIDTSFKAFTVQITPLDSSRFRSQKYKFERGERPLKYSVEFTTANTMVLKAQTTVFNHIQRFYHYNDHQLILDIYDDHSRESVLHEKTIGFSGRASRSNGPYNKAVASSRIVPVSWVQSILKKSIILAALITIAGGGLLVFIFNLGRNFWRSVKQVINPSQTKQLDGETNTSGAKPGSSFTDISDADIRELMNENGVTYDEARIMARMQRGDG